LLDAIRNLVQNEPVVSEEGAYYKSKP
jgi:hypothetical protein